MEAVIFLHMQALLMAASAGLAVGLMLLVLHTVFGTLAGIYKQVFK